MAVTKTSKEEVLAQYRRNELIAAARRVFGQRGFDHATMDAIAESAGVAKGTIYLYYPSKQAIYDATFRAGMAEIEQLTNQRLQAAATTREAIRQFVATRVLYFQENPDFFRLYVSEVVRQIADRGHGKGPCKAAVEGQTRTLQALFERAIAAGTIRDIDPAAAALAVFDITKGLTGRRVLTGEASELARDIDFITDLIWSGLEPEGPHA